MLYGWWICCKFTTILLQSKQWCFDKKASKWKQVSSMTSMYCFIIDGLFCSFFTLKLVKLRYFLGIWNQVSIAMKIYINPSNIFDQTSDVSNKLFSFVRPTNIGNKIIPPLEEENHLQIGYDSFIECISRCLLLYFFFPYTEKHTCVVNFNQQATGFGEKQPTSSHCRTIFQVRAMVAHYPFLLGLTDAHGFSALHHAVMSGDAVFISKVPRAGESTPWPWLPGWNEMCDSHGPIRYCVCKGDIANHLSKSYKSPQF